MRWLAVYTEHRVFRWDTHAWRDLPATGMLVVVALSATGRTIFSGADWYIHDGATISYVPSGPWGTWAPKPTGCLSCIKQGVGVSDAEFQEAHALALRLTEPVPA